MKYKFFKKVCVRKAVAYVLSFALIAICITGFNPTPVLATMEGSPVTSIVDGQAYYIRNKHSGMCLDLEWGGTESGTNVWQFGYNGTHAQQWIVDLKSDGYYTINPVKAPEKCLDVTNWSNNNGDNIWIVNDYALESSKFKILKNSDATFRILTKCSNNTKAVVVENASTAEQANVYQYTYTSASPRNDDWEFIKVNEYCAMNWAYFFRGDNPPVNITNPYSASTLHAGIDVKAPANTPIYSTTDGVVWKVGVNHPSMGNYVVIQSEQQDHTGVNLMTRNLHMSSTPVVSEGQSVYKGTVIGYVGDTGDSSINHIHFDVNNLGTWDGSTMRNNFDRVIQPEKFFCDVYFTYD